MKKTVKKKVLLVEDDDALAAALGIRLKSMGYSLIRADSISTGVSMLIKRQPDVSLIDINLPDGSGFSLAGQIKTNPNSPKTPVIFITASRNPDYQKQAQLFSPIAYLEKPFDASDLIEAIEFSHYANRGFKAHFKRAPG